MYGVFSSLGIPRQYDMQRVATGKYATTHIYNEETLNAILIDFCRLCSLSFIFTGLFERGGLGVLLK